jgi:hypothetical protein
MVERVQALEERAAVKALANAAAVRRREARNCSTAAYRAQQQRQWHEGGVTASKDVVWAQSVIDAAVGNALLSHTSTAAGVGAEQSGFPPPVRADSTLLGNVRPLRKFLLSRSFCMPSCLLETAWRHTFFLKCIYAA